MDPNIKRIGKYKSAGDQLLRKDMSEAQREQLTAILDDLYEGFTEDVAASKGKSAAEVSRIAYQQTNLPVGVVCCSMTWQRLKNCCASWTSSHMTQPFPQAVL